MSVAPPAAAVALPPGIAGNPTEDTAGMVALTATQLLVFVTSAIAECPETEPVAPGVLWLDSGVLTLSVGIPPVITDQPDNASINPGEDATFTLTATNATSYQWSRNTGSGWSIVSGATSASLTISAADVSMTGYQYRCLVTGLGGSVTSDTVTLTVTEVGLWINIPFDENSGVFSRNTKAVSAYSSTDLLAAPEQLFGLSSLNTSGTLTELGRTDPNGNSNASQWSQSAGSRFLGWNSLTFPAGTYTISVWAKSNTGVSQNLRLSPDTSGSNWGSNLAVATTWTRISRTVTNPSAILIGNDGSSAVDVDLWGFDVTSGSSPGTLPTTRTWEALARPSRRPGWSSAGMTFASNQSAWSVATGRPKSLTTASFYVVATRSGSLNLAGYAPLLSNNTTSPTLDLSALFNSTPPRALMGGITSPGASQVGPTVEGDGGLTHCFAFVTDGSTVRIYLDGIMILRNTGTGGTITVDRLFIANYINNAGYAGTLHYIKGFDVAHTASQVRQYTSALRSALAGRSVTVTSPANFIAFEGDSITAATSTTGYANLTALSPTTKFVNLSIGGSAYTHMVSRAAALDERITPGVNNILMALWGTNDALGSDTPSVYFTTKFKPWWQARRTAGWSKIIVGTLTPRSNATANTWLKALNDLILADTSFYDGLAHFDGDATIGRDQGGNATYYPDGLHPSTAGYVIMKSICDAALTAVLV